MKITKSTFIDIGQNGSGDMARQSNLLSSRGIPLIPPHKGTPWRVYACKCVCVGGGGWGGVNQCHKVEFWVHVIFSGQFCQWEGGGGGYVLGLKLGYTNI